MHSVAHSVTYLPTHLVTRSVASQSRVSRRGRQRISAASKHCYAASRSRRVSPRTVDFAVRTNERTNERPNERTNKRTNERTNERTNDDGGGTTYSRVQYSVAVFGVALLRCCSLLESGGCCSLRCGGAAAALLCCCVVVLVGRASFVRVFVLFSPLVTTNERRPALCFHVGWLVARYAPSARLHDARLHATMSDACCCCEVGHADLLFMRALLFVACGRRGWGNGCGRGRQRRCRSGASCCMMWDVEAGSVQFGCLEDLHSTLQHTWRHIASLHLSVSATP